MSRILRKIESLQEDVTAWQHDHRRKVDALEQRVDDIESSVATARFNTFRAAARMLDIEQNLLRRVEEIEKLVELRLLVRQGRLPPDYLIAFGVLQDGRQGAGVEDDELLHSAGERHVQEP